VTTTEYKLYCFAQSGNSYKAALMLNLCGAKWTPRFVDFFNGETRTPEYRKNVNEMGEAPVLEYGSNRLSQSGVILDYLAEEFGKFQGADRREVMRWLLWDNHKLHRHAALPGAVPEDRRDAGDRVPARARERLACHPRAASEGPEIHPRQCTDHRRHFGVRLPVLRR
jgi:glutathione S-transferase